MTPEQYAAQRLHMLENVVRELMSVTMQAAPLTAHAINSIGQRWDQALDRLDSACALANAVAAAPAHPGEQKEGEN